MVQSSGLIRPPSAGPRSGRAPMGGSMGGYTSTLSTSLAGEFIMRGADLQQLSCEGKEVE